MRVKLETLEKVVHVIFEHMRDLEVEEVELDNDYYWNIPFEKKYDRYDSPTDLDLGQLSEDWQDIINVVENRKSCSGWDLRAVSSILRYIGEKHAA